jgi:hypothetical protein
MMCFPASSRERTNSVLKDSSRMMRIGVECNSRGARRLRWAASKGSPSFQDPAQPGVAGARFEEGKEERRYGRSTQKSFQSC